MLVPPAGLVRRHLADALGVELLLDDIGLEGGRVPRLEQVIESPVGTRAYPSTRQHLGRVLRVALVVLLAIGHPELGMCREDRRRAGRRRRRPPTSPPSSSPCRSRTPSCPRRDTRGCRPCPARTSRACPRRVSPFVASRLSWTTRAWMPSDRLRLGRDRDVDALHRCPRYRSRGRPSGCRVPSASTGCRSRRRELAGSSGPPRFPWGAARASRPGSAPASGSASRQGRDRRGGRRRRSDRRSRRAWRSRRRSPQRGRARPPAVRPGGSWQRRSVQGRRSARLPVGSSPT